MSKIGSIFKFLKLLREIKNILLIFVCENPSFTSGQLAFNMTHI